MRYSIPIDGKQSNGKYKETSHTNLDVSGTNIEAKVGYSRAISEKTDAFISAFIHHSNTKETPDFTSTNHIKNTRVGLQIGIRGNSARINR
ncbi:hypothetical protein CCZ01_09295 [Helicobacter monodelphidis]|uniref:hypothetical protein n=1 Tax=Helicobacter sp. 15-1451 TaxID=2004995 RepID=UPI000DCCCFC9|nr:hypothetical protein [Helicobacter sp. 15-1451]RAX56508.1 hypothetical protein CCZ01_09295 [Helicobacter sp. 15-1451]